jgi:predicted DNA-binding transcriptional regulator YafY
MPRKMDDFQSYGQKLISLFARLLFTGEKYSLTEAARLLVCSKQTVLRLVDDIRASYKVRVEESFEGNRKYFQITGPRQSLARVPMTEREIAVLQMCQAFARHLLGSRQFEEATLAIGKSRSLLPTPAPSLTSGFESYRPGTIDYSPFQVAMYALVEAIQHRKVCKISYQAIMEDRPKTLYIKPLKIFSHKDTVYLHGQLAKVPGKPYKEPEFDPLMAIHRMKNVEVTDRSFEFPADYDFEKFFNHHFGIIKDEPFEVEARFSGWAARFVSERWWSPKQKIMNLGKDKVKISFSASSSAEVSSWILSFGEEAELLKPGWLRKELAYSVAKINETYNKT